MHISEGVLVSRFGGGAVLMQEEVTVIVLLTQTFTQTRVQITCTKAIVTILLSKFQLGSLVFQIRKNICIWLILKKENTHKTGQKHTLFDSCYPFTAVFFFWHTVRPDKESSALRPFPPSTSSFQFLSPRLALVRNFRTEFCKAKMKEVLFCLPSKLTVAFAILGNHPIIVPTCCSKAIFKVTPKCTHGCRAQLLRDDTLLLHPQPEEVQKSCFGNRTGTRIFVTWFYILTLKGCSNSALPDTPERASHLPFAFPPLLLLPDAWHCWYYLPPGLILWEPAVGVLP